MRIWLLCLLSFGGAFAHDVLASVSISDNFDGTSLSSTYWTPNRYTDGTTAPGTLSVSAGILNFGCKSLADTGGKYHFSGNQIIIEGRFAGTGSLRDTRVTLIEAADSSNAIHAGDTNYQGQGLYTAGSGIFTLSQTGIGNSTSAYKEYRLTITGASLTWERGDTLANITERTIRTLPVSIAGKSFLLSIGTGGPDYCPGSFDWIRITSDTATTGTTTTTVTSTGTAVEFYNNNLDNYFITADANEAAQIDSGAAGPGWSRTGYTFKSGGNTSVCRFYGSYSPGPNSHFYTVDPAECQGLKDQQIPAGDPRKLTDKSWNFESLDFVSTPPSNNTCPPGTTPVYRAYNNGFSRGVDSNHRITTSLIAIGEVVTRGWSNEGVVMCAPSGTSSTSTYQSAYDTCYNGTPALYTTAYCSAYANAIVAGSTPADANRAGAVAAGSNVGNIGMGGTITASGTPLTPTPTPTPTPIGYISQGGLTWSPNNIIPATTSHDAGVANWTDANAWCANNNFLGQPGWRLPTKDELVSLFNSGAIYGKGWNFDSAWSSTPYPGGGEHYNVYLNTGFPNASYDMYTLHVTCVR